jgi:multiple antibiotic resistance protein
MLVGRFVLNFFGISLPVLKIAGGLIVANTAWGMVGMVTGSSRMTTAESSEALTKEDISLTPVSTTPSGKCNAIRNRWRGEDLLTL